MQEDPFPAAERILSDIESIFRKDPELNEFDILPVTLNQNKSPVHHVNNCLGLELWCVRHVYCYAYHRLLDMRQQKNRRADPELQSRLLLGALLLNPDVQTFWNMRRELLQAGRLDFQAELHFTAVVLSRKPKCAEAFSYRKWIASKLKTNGDKGSDLLAGELGVARTAANRYANNYHAWQHCIWSLIHLAPPEAYTEAHLEEWGASKLWVTMHVSDHSGWQYRQFLLQQLCGPLAEKVSRASLPFINDKTLPQYLRPIISELPLSPCVQNATGCSVSNKEQSQPHEDLEDDFVVVFDECTNTSEINSLTILLGEMELSTELIVRYTGHEALWYHRRFLLTLLKSILDCNTCAETAGHCGNRKECKRQNKYQVDKGTSKPQEGDSPAGESPSEGTKLKEVLRSAVLWHEERLMRSDCGNCSDPNQQRLAMQHGKWLQQVLHKHNP